MQKQLRLDTVMGCAGELGKRLNLKGQLGYQCHKGKSVF